MAWAGTNGWAGHAWRIAVAMNPFFDARIAWREAWEFYQAAAEASGDTVGEAYTLNSLGACLYLSKGDPEQAKTSMPPALERFRQVNDVPLPGDRQRARGDAGAVRPGRGRGHHRRVTLRP